jgi:hypothetical protein
MFLKDCFLPSPPFVLVMIAFLPKRTLPMSYILPLQPEFEKFSKLPIIGDIIFKAVEYVSRVIEQ